MQTRSAAKAKIARATDSIYALPLIQDRLLRLIDTPDIAHSFMREDGVLFVSLEHIPKLYQEKFQVPLDPVELGYSSLCELVEEGLSSSGIVVHRVPPPSFAAMATKGEFHVLEIGRRDVREQQREEEPALKKKKTNRWDKRLDHIVEEENESETKSTQRKVTSSAPDKENTQEVIVICDTDDEENAVESDGKSPVHRSKPQPPTSATTGKENTNPPVRADTKRSGRKLLDSLENQIRSTGEENKGQDTAKAPPSTEKTSAPALAGTATYIKRLQQLDPPAAEQLISQQTNNDASNDDDPNKVIQASRETKRTLPAPKRTAAPPSLAVIVRGRKVLSPREKSKMAQIIALEKIEGSSFHARLVDTLKKRLPHAADLKEIIEQVGPEFPEHLEGLCDQYQIPCCISVAVILNELSNLGVTRGVSPLLYYVKATTVKRADGTSETCADTRSSSPPVKSQATKSKGGAWMDQSPPFSRTLNQRQAQEGKKFTLMDERKERVVIVGKSRNTKKIESETTKQLISSKVASISAPDNVTAGDRAADYGHIFPARNLHEHSVASFPITAEGFDPALVRMTRKRPMKTNHSCPPSLQHPKRFPLPMPLPFPLPMPTKRTHDVVETENTSARQTKRPRMSVSLSTPATNLVNDVETTRLTTSPKGLPQLGDQISAHSSRPKRTFAEVASAKPLPESFATMEGARASIAASTQLPAMKDKDTSVDASEEQPPQAPNVLCPFPLSDTEAAIEFIHGLRMQYKDQPWPTTQKSLMKFLKKRPHKNVRLQAWLTTQNPDNKPLAFGKMLNQLIMACIDIECMTRVGDTRKLIWDGDRAKLLCEPDALQTKLAESSDPKTFVAANANSFTPVHVKEVHTTLHPIQIDGSSCRVSCAPVAANANSFTPVHVKEVHTTLHPIQIDDSSCRVPCAPLFASNDISSLLALLSADLAAQLTNAIPLQHVTKIVLDYGRKPLAWVNGRRVFLGSEDRIVSRDEIQAIARNLDCTSKRAKVDGQLHRISAVQNLDGDTIGFSMRIGRHFSGSADILSDILYGNSAKSILFLGEAWTGKTTILRDVAGFLAVKSDVVVVDTKNDIGGDGDVPHSAIGLARRVMVPSPSEQSGIMVDCLEDIPPFAMVIDEVSNPSDFEALRVCRKKGVRLVTSACGSLRNIIQNTNWRLAFGVVEETCFDGAEPTELGATDGRADVQKVCFRRESSPLFDCVVEVSRNFNEWRIIHDTADAVDRFLNGQEYDTQKRTRNPETGSVQLDLERC